MKWKIAGIAMMGLCGAALAASPEKSEAPAVVEPAVKAEESTTKRPVTASDRRTHAKRVRCVTEQVTGSRFAKRVCHTEEEWDRLKDSSVEAVKNIQTAPVPLKGE